MASRYHSLDNPLNPSIFGVVDAKYSPLHQLHPGRPMPVTDSLDPYDIPHKSPEAARQAFESKKIKLAQYASNLEATARVEGGPEDKKVTMHTVDDPFTQIEDPELKFATIQQPPTENDAKPDFERVPINPRPFQNSLPPIGPNVSWDNNRPPVPLPNNGSLNGSVGVGAASGSASPKKESFAPTNLNVKTDSTTSKYLIISVVIGLLFILAIFAFMYFQKTNSFSASQWRRRLS
jgi:hypothetical protein